MENPNSVNIPETQSIQENSFGQSSPEDAYEDSKENLVYRLSELMFGSLLVSYLLGFVALTTSLSKAEPLLDYWISIFTYVIISLAFCFLTSGFYISYHSSVLTNPFYQYDDIYNDFKFAVLQALMFGLSILYPPAFPFVISLMIFNAFKIQKKQYNLILDKAANKFLPMFIIVSDHKSEESIKSSFKKTLDPILKKCLNNNQLKVWLPLKNIETLRWFFLILSFLWIAIYFGADYSDFFGLNNTWDLIQLKWKIIITLIINFSIFFAIFKIIMKVFSNKATIVSKKRLKELNEAYTSLSNEIDTELKQKYKKK